MEKLKFNGVAKPLMMRSYVEHPVPKEDSISALRKVVDTLILDECESMINAPIFAPRYMVDSTGKITVLTFDLVGR